MSAMRPWRRRDSGQRNLSSQARCGPLVAPIGEPPPCTTAHQESHSWFSSRPTAPNSVMALGKGFGFGHDIVTDRNYFLTVRDLNMTQCRPAACPSYSASLACSRSRSIASKARGRFVKLTCTALRPRQTRRAGGRAASRLRGIWLGPSWDFKLSLLADRD